MLTIKIIEPRASGPKALLNVYLVFKKNLQSLKKYWSELALEK